jgi:hypothetical protein
MSRKPNLFADSKPWAARPETATKNSGGVRCYALLLSRDNNVSLFRHNLLTDRHLAILRFHNRISSVA